MQSNKKFQAALNSLGIDLDIPENFDKIEFEVTKHIPSDDSLIPVPLIETFPLKIPDPAPQNGEVPSSIIESAAIEAIQRSRIPKSTIPKETEEKMPKKFLPVRGTTEDFVRIKREYQTFLSIVSKERNIGFTMEVCHHPTCMNVAVPTYKLCSYHLIKSGNSPINSFLKQKKPK